MTGKSSEDTSDLQWRKSSYSTPSGPDCVEVAPTPAHIHVRDSKNTHGAHLTFTPNRWATFVTYTTQQ
jgi:Domain of unknown function (DUF397)